MDEKKLRKNILYKLFRKRIINEKHTAMENALKGIPKHLKGDSKKILNELIKENLILKKDTCYGTQISLNSEKIKEILNEIKD
ncbi:MAG: hypothetical protein QXM96_04060 [Candidatus Woesearchaeota archaeon]